jgi:hypothetical protein
VPKLLDPVQFVLVAIAGWMNQRQQQTIEYLREENRVLREQLANRRLHFNDDQRRRLAFRAKGLGRKLLSEVATLVTPDTSSKWHRKLIAQKYDGHDRRGAERPRTGKELESLVVQMTEENRTWGYRRIQAALSTVVLGNCVMTRIVADHVFSEIGSERQNSSKLAGDERQHWDVHVPWRYRSG